MAAISELVVTWAGSPVVGGGVSVFYCSQGDEATALAALRTFYSAVNNYLPSGLQWTFPGSGDVLSEVTGGLEGAWSAAAPAPVTAIGSGTWANGVGLRIKWRTNGFKNGRRVTGATFMVPLVLTSYEGAGNIIGTTITAFQTPATALATTVNGIRIWSRPDELHTGGIAYPTVGAIVPDLVSWLRSRRV